MPRRSSKNKLGYIKQVEMQYYNFDDNYNVDELPNENSEPTFIDNNTLDINSNNIIDTNDINDNFEYIQSQNEKDNNINYNYVEDNQEEFDYTLLKVIIFLIMV